MKDNAELLEKLAHEKIKMSGKDELRDLEWEQQKTDRLTAEGNVVQDILQLDKSGSLARVLKRQMLKTMVSMGMVTEEEAKAEEARQGDVGEEAAATTAAKGAAASGNGKAAQGGQGAT
jgi:hypothetical protein